MYQQALAGNRPIRACPFCDSMKPAVVCPNRNDLFVPSVGTAISIRHDR
jgi:hypothetical protein